MLDITISSPQNASDQIRIEKFENGGGIYLFQKGQGVAITFSELKMLATAINSLNDVTVSEQNLVKFAAAFDFEIEIVPF